MRRPNNTLGAAPAAPAMVEMADEGATAAGAAADAELARAAVLKEVATAHHKQGEYAEAIAAYDEALQCYAEPVDPMDPANWGETPDQRAQRELDELERLMGDTREELGLPRKPLTDPNARRHKIPLRKRRIPGAKRSKMYAQLSDHHLCNTGKHFCCAASLGPKGGPEAMMEAVAARRERGEKARKAWNRIDLRRTRGTDDGPGPAAYVNRATRYGDVATEVAPPKNRKRPAPPDEKPCAVCYDHCWYGCGCACHDSDGGEVSSQEEEASDGEVLSTEIPLPARDGPRPSKPTPPRWLRQLLGREEEDFEVALRDLEIALRRPPSLPDEGNERECLVVARYLKAAGPDAAAGSRWMTRRCGCGCRGRSASTTSGMFVEAPCRGRRWLRVIEDGTGAKRAARRVNASIRAAKGRVADVFARACDDGICKARALAEALAPLAGPFVRNDALCAAEARPAETAPESGCPDCADTCWYGCDCPCHDQLMSEEEEEVVSREPPALGASIHVRVAGATQCFPAKVACVYEDAIDVLYDDAETFEARVPLSRVQGYDVQRRVPRARTPRVPRKKPPVHEEAKEACVEPRADKHILTWHKPAEQKPPVSTNDGLERHSQVLAGEKVLGRRVKGVRAWSTVEMKDGKETRVHPRRFPETPRKESPRSLKRRGRCTPAQEARASFGFGEAPSSSSEDESPGPREHDRRRRRRWP